MTVITLSAPFGAGGSEIGPAVARRLGVRFLDRAIPTEVAERLAVPLREALLREHAASGGAVILGRAAAIVLRDEPGALHVRLGGPKESRIEQGMRIQGI